MSAQEDQRHKTAATLKRISFAVSAASWAAVAVVICADVAGTRMMPPRGLDIATTWLMGTGALTLILPLASSADCAIIDLIGGALRLGDADLDPLLVPATRRRLRSIPAVGNILTHLACVAWTLSLIFSIQLGLGAYHMPPEASTELLRLLMAGAVWPTVLAVSGRVEARRHALFELAREGHRNLRGIAGPCEETLNIKRLTLLDGGESRRRGRYRRGSANDPTSATGA